MMQNIIFMTKKSKPLFTSGSGITLRSMPFGASLAYFAQSAQRAVAMVGRGILVMVVIGINAPIAMAGAM
jgi:hypothetical protein